MTVQQLLSKCQNSIEAVLSNWLVWLEQHEIQSVAVCQGRLPPGRISMDLVCGEESTRACVWAGWIGNGEWGDRGWGDGVVEWGCPWKIRVTWHLCSSALLILELLRNWRKPFNETRNPGVWMTARKHGAWDQLTVLASFCFARARIKCLELLQMEPMPHCNGH